MGGDLINKKDAKFIVKQIAKQIAKENGTIDCITYALKLVYDEMDELPTVDAEPVRHGWWIAKGDDDADEGKWVCSECGHEIYSDLSLMEELQEQGYALYCEHCGAKMDGEK